MKTRKRTALKYRQKKHNPAGTKQAQAASKGVLGLRNVGGIVSHAFRETKRLNDYSALQEKKDGRL